MTGERSAADHAAAAGSGHRALVGLVRRLVVKLSSSGIWQVAGFRAVKEAIQAEVFQGVGFWARPPGNVTAEAVVVNVGAEADHPLVIALRDKATQAAVADGCAADTTLAYNSSARLAILPSGAIEARSHSGVAVALATKADIDALRAIFDAWIVVPMDGGAALKVAILDPVTGWNPAGTTVLKGE